MLFITCPASPEDDDTSILLRQATFSWQNATERSTQGEKETGSLQLHNLNLQIPKVSCD